ncbi:hypothetical protein [Kocuria sp. CNJ-770]|uniref:hypothetical protein n=1 Tax=Kocuria sp. CNJ-770 TaxID=1904964 RepID=UPI0009F94111|nr:hypothetical protein [Kocuria sp. CNJ-770]
MVETEDPDALGPRDYRAFMRTETPQLTLPTVQDQFVTWLRDKGIDFDSTNRVEFMARGVRASVVEHTRGHDDYVRCRLVESETPQGTWCTEVVASSAGWIDLTVTNSEGYFVAVPKLARYLMQALDVRDASMQLLDEVKQWDINEVDRLVELLEDQDRHGLVFVAGTGDEPDLYEAFRKRVSTWTREVFGMAQSIVLTPRATQMLSDRLGYHAVGPWMLRTYYPGVAPAQIVDSRRHRYLTTATLANEKDWRLRQLLANTARRHAATRLDPTEVIRAKRAFARAETRALLAAFGEPTPSDRDRTEVVPSPAVISAAPTDAKPQALDLEDIDTDRAEPPAVAAAEAQLDLIRLVLGITSITRVALEQAIHPGHTAPSPESLRSGALQAASLRIKEQLDRIEELEDFRRDAVRALEDQQLERAELQDDLEKSRRTVRWLRDRFAEMSDYETAFGEAPEDTLETYPASCVELIDRLGKDQDVLVFTGDRNKARVVDDADTLQLAVRSAWEACIALREYVRARNDGNWDNGVDQFLKNRPEGYDGISAGKHGATETAVTMKQFGGERIFPVPAEVSSEQVIAMKAHFKLASIGMLSPRMHYHDDYTNTGKIYIGYIGRHLTNTMTN